MVDHKFSSQLTAATDQVSIDTHWWRASGGVLPAVLCGGFWFGTDWWYFYRAHCGLLLPFYIGFQLWTTSVIETVSFED
jgi:hypothetical protein